MMVRWAVLFAATALLGACDPVAQRPSASEAKPVALAPQAVERLRVRGISATTGRVTLIAELSPRTPWTKDVALLGAAIDTFDPGAEPAGAIIVSPNGGPWPGPANPPYTGLSFNAKTGMSYLFQCAFSTGGTDVRTIFVNPADGAVITDRVQAHHDALLVEVSDPVTFDGPVKAYIATRSTHGQLGACQLFEIDLTP